MRPMSNKYRLAILLILTALLAGGNAQAEVQVHGSVFGGGNQANVGSTATVNIISGIVEDSVFGGGKGDTTLVKGKVKVNIGKLEGGTPTGSAIIMGNVYGGSALGNVNATKVGDNLSLTSATDSTVVNIYKGKIKGNVFGGGLGRRGEEAIASNVYGPIAVTFLPSITAGIFT